MKKLSRSFKSVFSRPVLSCLAGPAVVALLLVFSAALHADDKDKRNQHESRPQRSEQPQQRSAPAPAPTVRSEPNRQASPAPGGGGGGGHRGNNEGGGNPGGRERVHQPNTNTNSTPNSNPDTGRHGGYQPNPNTGRERVYQPNNNPNTNPSPNTNPNSNNGRQFGGNPPTSNPNTNSNGGRRYGGNQPNSDPNANSNNGRQFGGNQPNSNNGRERNYQQNTNPNNGRQGGYQSNTNSTGNRDGSRYNSGSTRTYTPGRTRNGGEVRSISGGRTEYRGPNNSRAEFRRDGSIHEVHSRNMVITHGPVGTRRVIVDRPDHTRIVTYGRQRGYVQRSYSVHGREYYHRTYYVHGVAYGRIYRPYHWGGVSYYRYVPAVYYRPSFYGWVFSPWSSPVYYRWGWSGSPWYGYYGGYFSPYPAYPSASLWLTDYMISQNLQDAYQQQLDANGQMDPGYGQGNLSPEVKQAIAEEVQRQIGQERTESQYAQNPGSDPNSDAPPFADNNPHVFVVTSNVEVTTAEGQQCSLTPGDVIGVNGAPPPGSPGANVRVMASKGPDCAQNSIVAISIEDLQEMQNRMREVIDQGLGELQSREGQNGLPVVPPQARGQVQSAIANAAPQADPNAESELNEQDRLANQTEQEVVSQVSQDPNPQPVENGPPQPTQLNPITITMGQTPEQVVALLGQPKQIVDLGAKKMYVYTDMKITFIDGKVTDVQ